MQRLVFLQLGIYILKFSLFINHSCSISDQLQRNKIISEFQVTDIYFEHFIDFLLDKIDRKLICQYILICFIYGVNYLLESFIEQPLIG